MSAAPPDSKDAARRRLRALLQAMSDDERAEASRAICRRLAEQPLWRSGEAVLAYVPTRLEPDLSAALHEALSAGRRIALPRYQPDSGEYAPCLVRRWPEDLEPGRFGILEPASHCPIFDAKQLDLALVPGLGFTLDGGRLGRGKGYYDRLLAGFSGFKCGVAFDCQIMERMPLDPHDVRLNCILTPTRWHPAGNQPRF